MRNYSPVVNNQFMFSKHQYTPIYTKNVNIKFKGHGNVTEIMPILLKKLQMDHCRCLTHYMGKLIVHVILRKFLLHHVSSSEIISNTHRSLRFRVV